MRSFSTLTMENHVVFQHCGDIMDIIIKSEGDPMTLWHAFAQIVEEALFRSPLGIDALYVDNGTLLEAEANHIGLRFDEDELHGFNILLSHYWRELSLVKHYIVSNNLKLIRVEGFWREPMLYNNPMLLFLTQKNLQYSSLAPYISG